ncbi:4088_t:CDS:2, partial [Entrophospora sp. SA101]
MLEDQQNPFSIKYLSHDLSDEIIENSAVIELQLAGVSIGNVLYEVIVLWNTINLLSLNRIDCNVEIEIKDGIITFVIPQKAQKEENKYICAKNNVASIYLHLLLS